MIFVTVGTHTQPFDRLLREIDTLVVPLQLEVFGQTGHSDYQPQHFPSQPFLSDTEYHDHFMRCSLVVSHAGAGTIITAMRYKKPIIIIPRLKEKGEHTNNHQHDLARKLEKKNVCTVVYNIKDLGKAIKAPKRKHISTTSNLLQTIAGFIDEVK